jgi:cold shock CspA family protein
MSDTQETVPARILGQVKWFNNKAGYGFITVNDGEHNGKDIFVHYSAIRVANSQYKYLTQGEYVEFVLDKSNNDAHELQATDVSGLKNGKLMCEIRRSAVAAAPAEGGESRPAPRYRRYKVAADDDRRQADAADGFERVQRRKPARRPVPKREGAPQAVSASA